MPKFVNTWTEEEEAEWERRLLAGAEIVGGDRDADSTYWGGAKGAAEVPTMSPTELVLWAIEVALPPPPPPVHGEVHMYYRGCRCEPCRGARRQYDKTRRQKEAASAPTALTA